MAIEIKELVIKFKVEESPKDNKIISDNQQLSDHVIKKIVDECTEKVLRNITKHTDR